MREERGREVREGEEVIVGEDDGSKKEGGRKEYRTGSRG